MPTRQRIRALAFPLVLLVIALVPHQAIAAMMHHYDLTSLALMSDAIVRAKRGSERKVGEYTKLTTYEVVTSYAGELAPGQKLELDTDLYATQPMEDLGSAKAPRVLSDEVFLFLERVKPERREAGKPGWYVLSSGLRIVLDGRVQRFEQWSNPGGFSPVPQRRDPWDLLGDPRAGAAMTPAELAEEIPRVLARVAEIRRTIASPSSPERTRALLDMLGPEEPPEDGPASTGHFGFASNEASRVIVLAIADTKDLRASLDAIARAGTVPDLGRGHFPLERILDAALDRSLPPRLRAAALLLAQVDPFALRKSERASTVAITLLSDPSVEVRREASTFAPEEKASEATTRALLARFPSETDSHVRLALFDRLRDLGAHDRLSYENLTLPLAHAERRGRALAISWTDRYADRYPHWELARIVVRARPAGASQASTREVELPLLSRSSSRVDGARARIAFPKPLEAGTWTLEAEIALTLEKHPRETRTFALGTVSAGAEGLYGPLPGTEVAVVDAGVAIDAGAPAPPPPAPAPARKACGCSLPGARNGSSSWPLVGLGACVAVAASRRRRRSSARELLVDRASPSTRGSRGSRRRG